MSAKPPPADHDAQLHATRQFIEALPHSKALGMRVLSAGPGTAELAMAYDPQFVGDPETGVIHGGAVSALMDTCCGAAAMAHPDVQGITATIDLRIDYMRPATPGQCIRAQATCYHVTRNVAFLRARAIDDDEERPVASATGTFTAGTRA
ncbi:MAG: PaaI family thioesterase [Pseudomonadota bacterium]